MRCLVRLCKERCNHAIVHRRYPDGGCTSRNASGPACQGHTCSRDHIHRGGWAEGIRRPQRSGAYSRQRAPPPGARQVGRDHFDRASDADCFKAICDSHTDVVPTERYPISDSNARLVEIAMLEQRACALEAEVLHRAELERRLRPRQESVPRGHVARAADALERHCGTRPGPAGTDMHALSVTVETRWWTCPSTPSAPAAHRSPTFRRSFASARSPPLRRASSRPFLAFFPGNFSG